MESDDTPTLVQKVVTSAKKKKLNRGMIDPEDAHPHDGLTRDEAEDALLAAILPTLPKQAPTAVRAILLIWSSIARCKS